MGGGANRLAHSVSHHSSSCYCCSGGGEQIITFDAADSNGLAEMAARLGFSDYGPSGTAGGSSGKGSKTESNSKEAADDGDDLLALMDEVSK